MVMVVISDTMSIESPSASVERSCSGGSCLLGGSGGVCGGEEEGVHTGSRSGRDWEGEWESSFIDGWEKKQHMFRMV
jgi:hypothetical protein